MVLGLPILKHFTVVRSTNDREYMMMSVSPVTLRYEIDVKCSGIDSIIFCRVFTFRSVLSMSM